MKILMLSKRRPQGRDLFTRPYGRFFHLPRLLAEAGHTVSSACAQLCEGSSVAD